MDSPLTPNCLRLTQCQSIKLSPLPSGERSGKMTPTSTSPRRSVLHKTFSATTQLPPTLCNSRPSRIALASARDSTTHTPHRSPVYLLDAVERRGLHAIVVPSLGFWSTDPDVECPGLVQINGRVEKETGDAQGICGTFLNRWSRTSQMLRYRRHECRYTPNPASRAHWKILHRQRR